MVKYIRPHHHYLAAGGNVCLFLICLVQFQIQLSHDFHLFYIYYNFIIIRHSFSVKMMHNSYFFMTNISEVMIFIGIVCHRGFFLVTSRAKFDIFAMLSNNSYMHVYSNDILTAAKLMFI